MDGVRTIDYAADYVRDRAQVVARLLQLPTRATVSGKTTLLLLLKLLLLVRVSSIIYLIASV